MRPLSEIWIWDDPRLREWLDWYLAVADNRRPAKFRIAATIPIAKAETKGWLEAAPEEDLWTALESLTPVFLRILDAVKAGAPLPPACRAHSLLDLLSALAHRMLAHCNFCEWNCGVDRTVGGRFGTCKLGAETRVSTFFHHDGEELIYRGRLGSGTIFFTSCNMRCAFCQNGDISTDKDNGITANARTLAAMAWILRHEGCHNINWVGGDPTIHLHSIVEAIRLLGGDLVPGRLEIKYAARVKDDPFACGLLDPALATYGGRFNAPMLWNSNFFMSADCMKVLRPLIDVWLPDFKFGPGDCAKRLARTPWYWDIVTRNLQTIHEWGEPYTIRHLVMPNHVECCTRPLMAWIAEHLPGAPVNIMDQFLPDTFTDPHSCAYQSKYEDLSRCPTDAEIRESYRIAHELGINFETVTFEKSRSRRRMPRLI